MRRSVAVVLLFGLGAGCGATKKGAMTIAIAGAVAVGGGIALVATAPEETCSDHGGCVLPPAQWLLGALAVVIGGGMVVGGSIGHQLVPEHAPGDLGPLWMSSTAPVGQWARPLTEARVPLVIDPTQKGTPQDRAALQASVAARRGDCAAVYSAMAQIEPIDPMLHEKLATTDAPIAQCMLALPR